MKRSKMGLWGAVSIAVGTMIGASIFSVFGLGARIAGHNLPFVFVLSGALALLVAYSYAKLGSTIVSNAGPIEFILRGLGDGVVTGALAILSWFTYVVSIALFAKGFAGYFQPAAGLSDSPLITAIVELAVIVFFTAIGLAGSKIVGRAEIVIVAVKISVLGLFIMLGIWTIRPEWIVPAFSAGQASHTLDAVAVFFLSYMGFGLITNASEDIEQPEHNVPRAIYLSVLIVTLIYVLVAAVAVGNLPLEDLIRAEDNALAEAAKPFLGKLGYTLVSLGALFSIASALNATLFGGANVAYALAREGELPKFFERKSWFGASEGLYLTAALGLSLALTLDLNGLASITSAVFMTIYLFVLASHYRLVEQCGGNRALILLSMIVVSVVFVILLHYQWTTNRAAFFATWATFGLALLVEAAYRSKTGREMVVRELTHLRRVVHDLAEHERER